MSTTGDLFPFTANDISFDYRGITQRICTGEQEIENLGSHLNDLGARRVLVVCGSNVFSKSDVVSRVEAELGHRFVGRFSEGRPHAPLDVLRAAHELSQELRPDTVISVGGGSTMAIAKGLAVLDATDEDLESFAIRFEPPDRLVAPTSFPTIRLKVVSVPTTIGCAEIGLHVGGFTTRGRTEKITIAGDGQTGPHLVVIDGLALTTTPVQVQRCTAVGQLRIAIESFASKRHNPYSDALSLHAARLLVAALESGWEQTPPSLLRIKIAAVLASLARVQGYGACSAVAHQLGAVCDVGHGEANAVMLAPVMRWNAAALGPRLRVLADALGVSPATGETPDELGGRLAEFLTSLNVKLEIPTTLRDLGIQRSSLTEVAAATLRDLSLYTNPRPITTENEVLDLLESAW